MPGRRTETTRVDCGDAGFAADYYEGLRIEGGLRLDLVVEKLVIIEIKAVEKMIPVFDAQLLTYLKLTGLRLGLLINFNVPLIKNGIKRIVL